MGYVKTKGIILKEINTGEADKIVTIFSRSHGKLTGSAKGARRPKNKFAAATQFLCYCDFVLYKGKDMYSISSADIIEPFYEIRNDVFKLTYSAHMVDLVNDVIQENQPAAKVLQLFLNTLHMLAKTGKSPELLIRIFEIRFMSIIGYAPYVKECMECNECNADLKYFFSFRKCGTICGGCRTKDSNAVELSQGALRALRHIVHTRFEDLYSFDLAPHILDELGRISKRYIKDRLEREYKKLDFIKELENPI
ncbi:MAG: DNA repair protein RecO [Clostridia bacterium]|nr:DNA repair protein RecO [Clostridia bacterium]